MQIHIQLYMRYHTTHDRAYQRASKELRERQKERRLAEIGFAREKRAQAEEARRVEVHVHKVRTAKAQADRTQADATIRSLAAADTLCKAVGPELAAQAAAHIGLGSLLAVGAGPRAA